MTFQPASTNADWLLALKAYLGVTAIANLAWETLHLPLYTIWTTGSPREQACAVLHCTKGDLRIARSGSRSDRRRCVISATAFYEARLFFEQLLQR